MKASLEFMLIFFLLMLSFGVSGSVVDSRNESMEVEKRCQMAEYSANDYDSAFTQYLSGESKPRSLAISDIEPNIRFVETYTFSRLRRFVDNNDSFKGVMYKFSLLRDSSLLLDQSKSYCSDQDPYYYIISNDYYVFALRHILI